VVDYAFAQRFSERFSLLSEVNQRIASILEIDELLTQVACLIQQAFNYYHVGIGLIEGDEVAYRVGAGELWDDPNFQFKPQRLKIGSEGLSGWVAATGKPLIVPDVTRDRRYIWMQGSRTQSELIAPIMVKGKIVGVLDVQSQQADGFEQTDLDLMQAIASQTGVAIENARLFAETQRLLKESEQHASELEIINNLQLRLVSKLDMKGIYKLVGEKLRGIFDVHGIVIYSFDHEHHLVIDEYAYEKGKTYEISPLRMTPFHQRVISRGETICIQQNAKRFFDEHNHTMPVGEMPRSCIIVPFKTQGRVTGMIGIFDIDREFAFSESDVRIMETLANSMAVALESARLFAETQRLLTETEQRAGELGIINNVQQALASKLDMQSIYELVGNTFDNFFNAQVVVISTYDAQTNTVEHRYAIERGRRIPWPGAHPPGGFRDQIIHTRKPFLVNTNVGDIAARLNQPILQGTDTPRSWLGVPIMTGDAVTGILSVQNLDRENAFDESDIRLLQTFASSMSIALENARLYKQARQLAVLEERQRLARELHDSVTQSLYGISLYAQAAAGNIHAGEIRQAVQYLDDIQNTSQESLADMRLLIFELKPPLLEKEGLLHALQQRLNSVEDRARIKSRLHTNLTGRLAPDIEHGLYQIAREGLNNVIKHARAKNVSIQIDREADSVTMEIVDDGIGFDLEKVRSEGCLGIGNMQEHAQGQGWNLNVESSVGKGTRIRVEIKHYETESGSS
jgi:signal transduction histidine kinase